MALLTPLHRGHVDFFAPSFFSVQFTNQLFVSNDVNR
jgi:hypothetical protein